MFGAITPHLCGSAPVDELCDRADPAISNCCHHVFISLPPPPLPPSHGRSRSRQPQSLSEDEQKKTWFPGCGSWRRCSALRADSC